jgi:precorrin-2 methylase
MIEVTMTEVLLFAWAIVATVYAFKFQEEKNIARMILHEFVTNDKAREHVVAEWQKHKAKMEG